MYKLMSLIGLTLFSSLASATPLTLDVYNPGQQGIFPVSSTLVVGEKELLLVDAQFERQHTEALVQKIKQSGKKLSTIYISHADPDFYFGLDVLTQQFPDAKVVATEATVKQIQAKSKAKLAYWGPILKHNAPAALVVPEVLTGNTLQLEGHSLQIIGSDSQAPNRTVLWIPSIKAVVGGVLVFDQMHLWLADTQSKESRALWQQQLEKLQQLKPQTVVPGHYLQQNGYGVQSLTFTLKYLKQAELALSNSKTSADLQQQMKALYPGLGGQGELDLSSKVLTGEMKWPQ